MSRITYHIGSKEYSFDSKLQMKGIPLITVEENLNNEIKLDLKKRGVTKCKVHDIYLSDDNGIIACADDLSKIYNLKIVKQ